MTHPEITHPDISVQPHLHDTMPGFRLFQALGFISFAALSIILGIELAKGATAFGPLWLLPMFLLGYIAADFLSGFVHFLADNFGTPETPVVGRAFVLPFREHHVDPKGIVAHPFFIANGNNCLVTLPPLVAVWLLVPVATSRAGYLFGAFSLFLSIAIFLTNQFHKWAHMDLPPRWVQWLQAKNLVLPKDHHDIHHVSPFDTYYCITAGWCNPFLQRIRFFERVEWFIRRYVPGVSREKPPTNLSLNE